MDRLERYRDLIKRGLTRHQLRRMRPPRDEIEAICVFDDEGDNYILQHVGWNDPQRVEKTMLHVRLREGKIWIETDDTEDGFATELLRAGVPNSDIVLAFHPPHMRQYTDFAVA